MAQSTRKKDLLQPVPPAPPEEPTPVDSLLSGVVSPSANRPKQDRRKKRIAEILPRDLRKFSDVLAAARSVQREIEFKMKYAEHRVREHCLRELARLFVAGGKRQSSVQFSGEKSRFTFILTTRTSLNQDKVAEIRAMGVEVDRHTELRGLRINYEAIRSNGLEGRLRDALHGMGLAPEVLAECFVPEVQLKENFYDLLDNLVRDSLKPGESLEEKLFQVVQVLAPSTQIRNIEAVGLDVRECLDLILNMEISLSEEEGNADW